MDVRRPSSVPISARVIPLVLAVFAAVMLVLGCMRMWRNHWVLKDGARGTATIIGELWTGHRTASYRYTVDQTVYSGWSERNTEEPGRRAEPGDDSIVYYSASHPWLSSLHKPSGVYDGGPAIFLFGGLEVLALAALIWPEKVLRINRR